MNSHKYSACQTSVTRNNLNGRKEVLLRFFLFPLFKVPFLYSFNRFVMFLYQQTLQDTKQEPKFAKFLTKMDFIIRLAAEFRKYLSEF